MRVMCFQRMLPFVCRHIGRAVSAKWISNVDASPPRRGSEAKKFLSATRQEYNELISNIARNFDEFFNVQNESWIVE